MGKEQELRERMARKHYRRPYNELCSSRKKVIKDIIKCKFEQETPKDLNT